MTIKIGYEQGYQQGKAEAAEWMKARDDALAELSAEIAALRAENARLQADGIHSCHDGCTRSGCVNARLREQVERMRLELQRWSDGFVDDAVKYIALQAKKERLDRVCGLALDYLRGNPSCGGMELIAAIDAAMGTAPPTKGQE